ncbi:MAG: DUF1273 domain-containing protein [Ruminiclostridium sp.]|nr:DUF1273 domain-containing protein [Ruminiclostridium sp.]
MDRTTTCCFTGHRPDRLPWREREDDPRCLALKAQLRQAVEQAYGQGFRHFICGMARGADLYFCEAVLALAQEKPDLTVEAAIPFTDQAAHWPEADQARRAALLDCCHYETVVQHRYSPSCMARRNRYMVDHSALLLAVYDGTPKGGTAGTLAYALQQGLDTLILDPRGW